MSHINPKYQPGKKRVFSKEELVQGIRNSRISELSQCITLLESTQRDKVDLAHNVLDELLPVKHQTKRIGITGVPGVGKSTFIESLGQLLTDKGLKVAVLAVDPSSNLTGGSILGDKTRMESLSTHPGVFIRPTPSAGALGGVANATRDTILLCEAAGFDVILVETVGVGQSETEVAEMVDFFMLLMLAGAGDELQGIKRGIMEMADMLVINKAEGDNLKASKQAQGRYKSALHLMPGKPSGWVCDVKLCSAIEHSGIGEVWQTVEEFFSTMQESGYLYDNRKKQAGHWFDKNVQQLVLSTLVSKKELSGIKDALRSEVTQGSKSPHKAAREFLDVLLSNI